MAERIRVAGGMHSKAPGKRAAIRAIQNGESFLYAVTTRQGAIKIGVSIDVALRISTNIRFGGTERILAFAPGSFDDEQAIHDSLADFALPFSREYYYPTDEVIAVVQEIESRFDLHRHDDAAFGDLLRIAAIADALVARRSA